MDRIAMPLKTRKNPTQATLTKLAQAKRSLRKSMAKTAARPKAKRAKSSREKVKAYRARMRKRGMKLVQIWVPDPSSPEFAKEARRQSLRAARSPTEHEDQAFMDAVTDWNWE